MKSPSHLLQIYLHFNEYKFALLCFVSAFLMTLLVIPPIISFIRKYHLYDLPNARKEHHQPAPTLGGIAIVAGMGLALLLWLPFHYEIGQIAFFFSVFVLFITGIMDDLRDLSAKYKFAIQIGVALLIALSGIRITSFSGLFGITELPVFSQYTFTVLAIVGITNAFNMVDGIDGLAGGLAFMSLVTLGLFLTISGDANTALVAFSLAGGILAFLYFNFNPARIFMGDTGSLVIGFVIAVLCIRLLQVNLQTDARVLLHAPVFVLGIVLVPVFDTLRVFMWRIWNGKSPFQADRTHIHHLLTNRGFNHGVATRVICCMHAIILIEVYLTRELRQEWSLLLLVVLMILFTLLLRNLRVFYSGTRHLKELDNSSL